MKKMVKNNYDIWYTSLSSIEKLELQDEFNFDDWDSLPFSQKKIIYNEATGKETDVYEPD
ncbi:MAG: hypothetical protein PHD33_05215 [Atribacterota bacterium]|nr:hypothetical protein [Atribacterota bacterium]